MPAELASIRRAARLHPRVDCEARTILSELLILWQRHRGHCAPTLRTLGELAKLSIATVKRRLQLLEALGFLTRQRRAVIVDAEAGWRGPARWQQTSTAYHPQLPADCEAQAEPRPQQTEKKQAQEGGRSWLGGLLELAADTVEDARAELDRRRRARELQLAARWRSRAAVSCG